MMTQPQYLMITHLVTGVISRTGEVTHMTGETVMEATEAQLEMIAGTVKEAAGMITDLTKEAEEEDTRKMIEATAEAAEVPKATEPKTSDLGGQAPRAQVEQRVQHCLKRKEKRY